MRSLEVLPNHTIEQQSKPCYDCQRSGAPFLAKRCEVGRGLETPMEDSPTASPESRNVSVPQQFLCTRLSICSMCTPLFVRMRFGLNVQYLFPHPLGHDRVHRAILPPLKAMPRARIVLRRGTHAHARCQWRRAPGRVEHPSCHNRTCCGPLLTAGPGSNLQKNPSARLKKWIVDNRSTCEGVEYFSVSVVLLGRRCSACCGPCQSRFRRLP